MKITYKTNKTVTGRDIKTNSVKLQGFLRDGIIFRTTVRFLNIHTGIWIAAGATINLIVGGFNNSCRLTDVNLNNLRTINQDFYILNSILIFNAKNWNKPVRGSEL
jgi:hypothetical protein